MIKDFLSIIYNNIVSTCYDTNKENNDITNINDNRELFKDYTSLYNDIKLTNLDLCLNKELKDDSKDDLKDDSKDDLSSCYSDVYDKVDDFLD